MLSKRKEGWYEASLINLGKQPAQLHVSFPDLKHDAVMHGLPIALYGRR